MRSPFILAISAALAITGLLAAGLLVLILVPTPAMSERVDKVGAQTMSAAEVVFRPEDFRKGAEPPEPFGASWPWFRGTERNNISTEEVSLARTWDAEGPPKLWEVSVGIGYAGPAIRNGCVYLLDYDQEQQTDVLRCLSLVDGKEIWRRWYKIPIESDHGITRTVPAVDDSCVVTIGPKGQVICCETQGGEKKKAGDLRWSIDMVTQFKTHYPKWYMGQCPMLDFDKIILAPAGKEVLLAAVNLEDGKILWTTPNKRAWKMTHSSVVPWDIKEGLRTYVYAASGGVVGVAADDNASEGIKAGEILWEYDHWKVPFANVPAPVPVGGGRLLLTGGYSAGSVMIQIKPSEKPGAKFKYVAEQVWRLEKSAQFGSDQHSPILYGGMVFGVLPKDAGPLGGQMVCMDLAGEHVWESGPKYRFGLGPYMIADGLLLAMDDEGNLTMAEASSAGFKPLASAKVLQGHESWAPMAISGGRLLVRDINRLVCLDMRKKE
jgi:outer membrane protein assembly factor BamB